MWKVVPLSQGQLTDVRPEDVLNEGLYRKCETYRGGGGYDQFPVIAEKRLGFRHHQQFIVQLFGCSLDCPYCYVTREGVWGRPERVSTDDLVKAFIDAQARHGATVFHLMGGAPALQIKHWPDLLHALNNRCVLPWVFHSDMMLTEQRYPIGVIEKIVDRNALYAVDVKGLTDAEHLTNTRKSWRLDLFWENLNTLEALDVPFYLTFTAISDQTPLWDWYREQWPARVAIRQAESFSISLIQYDALPFVDRVPWGAQP